MSQATADVLLAAADLLERTGWCQGTTDRRHKAQERHCALGALLTVSPSGARFLDAEVALRLAVGTHVSVWNDDVCTRRSQVVAKLREVAAQEAKS